MIGRQNQRFRLFDGGRRVDGETGKLFFRSDPAATRVRSTADINDFNMQNKKWEELKVVRISDLS